jgi:exopolysaccharide biosynthesis polyprenyl glycosylphosphotransferase
MSSGERNEGGRGHLSLQLQETIDGARLVGHADVIERPLPKIRLKRAQRVALIGRLGLVFLPAFTFSLGQPRGTLLAVGAAASMTGVWFATMRTALSAARPARAALGQAGAAALASLTGAVAVSALALWIPWLSIRAVTVVQVAAAVFVLQLAWERLVRASAAERRRVLIVGAHDGGEELVEELWLDGDRRYEVVGVVDDERAGGTVAGVPVLGTLADLSAVVEEQHPDLVVLAVANGRLEAFTSLLDAAGSRFDVLGLAEFHEQAFGRVPVRHLNSAWFMSILDFYRRPYGRFAKRAFDLLVAAAGLLLTAPLFPVIALLVRRTPGPVIFAQQRLGEGGRCFTIYKFRTMRADAEEGRPIWAEERDPRATALGRFLRRSRLDELPQLWNVLKGEMSIVGPRPERPEFLAELQEAVPFWTRRHLVKPGITGWAQVKRGYTADAEGTAEKLSYDLWYLRHRSLVIDLAICARTFTTLLSGAGSR